MITIMKQQVKTVKSFLLEGDKFCLGQSPRNRSDVSSYTGEDITEDVDWNNNNEDEENAYRGETSGISRDGLFHYLILLFRFIRT